VDRSRYWYSTQPSVTRLAQDRAAQLSRDDVWAELVTRLRADRARGDFAAVHIAPTSSGDVPDEPAARLVVLGPGRPHTMRAAGTEALAEAAAILSGRGTGPRLYQNMLAFLAPDRARLAELEEGIRNYLAWKSIHDERDALNLDTFQRNQAETKLKLADDTIRSRVGETYALLLWPSQPDARTADLTWDEARVQGQDSPAVRAARKLKNDGQLIDRYSAASLVLEMNRYNLWGEGDHVAIRQLWEYFARYPYLPRLLDANVLLGAIQDGIAQVTWQENFAYAEGYDAESRRYLNLKAGQAGSVMMDARSLLVKPKAALAQLQRDKESVEPGRPIGGGPVKADARQPEEAGRVAPPPPPPQAGPRRFYGTVEVDPTRMGRDAGQIAEAVVQHLQAQPGARVKVVIEIQAELSQDAPDSVVRTVTENARTLRFKTSGFEEA
jgi:hypothetical protein